MSIQVQCPHGHVFKVKDKYAGKKGLCPHCNGEVVVHVPELTDGVPAGPSSGSSTRAMPYSIDQHDEGSVYDDLLSEESGASLPGSSGIRQGKQCAKCGTKSPIWYASCQKCGEFLKNT